jgi:phospholipid transport system substrate-binding protein
MQAPATPEVRAICLAFALCFAVQARAQQQESAPAATADTAQVAATGVADMFTQPATIINRLHGTLLSVMQQADEMGYAGRYRVLDPVISTAFDTPVIVKVILSNHWGELSAQQQSDFIELFRRLSVATYASRFNGYDRETFTEIAREALNRGRLLIKTELQRPEKKPVRLDYLMHRGGDGEWRIISVIANGVNDLSLKRAEYAVVIKERGFDALVVDIQNKIKELESGASKPDAL